MYPDSSWVVLIVIFVVVPFFFWYRIRVFNKRKESVMVRCPDCGKDQRIRRVMNYTCVQCGSDVTFFDDEGTPLDTSRTYTCAACGECNVVGVLTCTACGKANQSGVPPQ